MSETEEMSFESIAKERLSQLAKEISWVEKEIPKVTKDYNEKMKELEKCVDTKRLKVLRSYVREKRLFLKYLQKTRQKLIKEIWFLLKQIEGRDNYV